MKQQQNVHLPDYTMEHYLCYNMNVFSSHYKTLNISYTFFKTKKKQPYRWQSRMYTSRSPGTKQKGNQGSFGLLFCRFFND